MTQREKILKLYNDYPNRYFTPFEVHNKVAPTAPLTSIRRELTVLTGQGILTKTSVKAPGDYGKPNHTWGLA